MLRGGYTQSKIDSGFPNPIGVAVDAAGNVFVLDEGYTENDGAIYRETPANSAYTRTTIASGLDVPEGIAIDGNGNLYVANFGNNTVTVMFLQPNGAYVGSTLGGGWIFPTTVAVDGKGGVYVTDTPAQDGVQKVDLSVPPSLSFASTVKGSTSKDSPQTVPVLNLGNAPLKFSAVSFPADFPEAAKATGDCKSTTQLAAGASCTLTVDFTPVAALGSSKSQVLNENVTLTTNTLNVAATKQKIAVTGTETAK